MTPATLDDAIRAYLLAAGIHPRLIDAKTVEAHRPQMAAALAVVDSTRPKLAGDVPLLQDVRDMLQRQFDLETDEAHPAAAKALKMVDAHLAERGR